MTRRALITGITGQDGAYLSELLLKKGYEVIGLVRGYISANTRGLEFLNIDKQVRLLECDLTDLSQVIGIIQETRPSEIYNLAAQSSVFLSFKQPIGTISFNILSVLNLLEAVRLIAPETRFYQASSSEIFGSASHLPISESSPIAPINPYSISKASAYWITKNYREAYGLYSCSGFLFNHESFLRSENFFVKKLIRQAWMIKNGDLDIMEIGNLEVKRDFGWAPKYVEAMHLILQQNAPDDFVICSGESVSLRSIAEFVFEYFDIPISRLVVKPSLFRPTEINDIYGDNSKARRELGWEYDLSFFEVLKTLMTEEAAYQESVRQAH